MDQFGYFMERTMDVFNTAVSIYGHSFTFLDIVGYTVILSVIVRIVRVIFWLDDD